MRPATTTVPTRGLLEELAEICSVTLPLPEPCVPPWKAAQSSVLLAVHEQPCGAETEITRLPPAAGTSADVPDNK